MLRLFIIPFLLVMLILSIVMANNSIDYKIYYIPLDVNFYTPVTTRNIEERAFYVFNLKSNKIDRLYRIVFKGNVKTVPATDDRGVRVKIINNLDERVIFITRTKEVIADGKKYNVDVQVVNNALKDIHEKSQKIKMKNLYQ